MYFRKLIVGAAFAFAGAALHGVANAGETEPADIILYNANIWTADDAAPSAQAVAVRGDKIVKVGADKEVLALGGRSTRKINLKGKFVVPGFIDGHTHTENATEWFFDARLMDVATEDEMVARLKETVARVPKGMWITGGDWGEMEARAARAAGDASFVSFTPSLARIDAVSPDHPVLFRRHNGDYFANSMGMKLMRITKYRGNPGGGEYVHDPKTGELTGMLLGRAGERTYLALPPKSMAHTLVAARAIMHELNSYGITGIHDIARIDAVSQQMIYHAHVERSHSDLNIFRSLREEGALTVRVYAMLPLSSWDKLEDFGVHAGDGDNLIRIKALKSFMDGYYMFEPYANNPNYAGDFTFRVSSPEEMEADVIGADALGYDMAIHMIGDKAISLAEGWIEKAIQKNGPRDRRIRLIHFEYPGMPEIKKAAALGGYADVTPTHMLTARNSIEKKVGPERAKTTYAFRTYIDNGVKLNLVSDWPGDFYKLHPKPVNPLVNIFEAVTMRAPGEPPEAAWHPEEGITIEEGLRAYTINPAYASHEVAIKGSITEGKLADIVVLDKDILEGTPEDLLTTKVVYTMFAGKIVYKAK